MPVLTSNGNRHPIFHTLLLALSAWLVLPPLSAQDLLTVITTHHVHFDPGTNHNDSTENNADLRLEITWTVPETQAVISVEAEEDLCFVCNANDPFADMPTMATYLECSPYDNVTGSGEIWEADSSVAGGIAVGLVSIGTGVLGLIAEVGTAGVATLGVISVGGSVIGTAWALNSDEHLGTLPAKKFPQMPGGSPGHGDDLVWNAQPNAKKETEQNHGNARVYLNVSSAAPAQAPLTPAQSEDQPSLGPVQVLSPDDSVCPPPATKYLLFLDDIRGRFDELSELYGSVDTFTNENEFGVLSLEGLQASRDAFRDSLFGAASMTAGALADFARPFEGGEVAWQRFLLGLEQYAAGEAEAAFVSMREAAVQGYDVFFYQNGGGIAGGAMLSANDPSANTPSANTVAPISDAVLLLNTPTLLAPHTPESSMRLAGKVFGLAPGEDVIAVSVDGIALAGLEAVTVPGTLLTGVATHADLAQQLSDADFEGVGEGHVMGLRRFDAAMIAAPDVDCPVEHLIPDGSAGDASFFDGEGPFNDPDPDGCGFGEVVAVNLAIDHGGIPASATFLAGAFSLLFELDETVAIPSGSHTFNVSAKILEPGGGEHTITTPLTLVVPERHPEPVLFQEDFESGALSFWSASQGG